MTLPASGLPEGSEPKGGSVMAPTTVIEQQDKDARKAEFERVMNYATERAWVDGIEHEVMAALFDVLNGELPEDDADAGLVGDDRNN